MIDLIYRQAAIDEAEEWIETYDSGRGGQRERDAIKRVISGIKKLPSAQPEQKWIPCSERMPEVRQWVLCQCRAGIMDVLRLTADGSWYKAYPHAEYMSGFVVAWMPLPEPYQEEDK